MRVDRNLNRRPLRPATLAAFALALLALLVALSIRKPDAIAPLGQDSEASSGNSITEGRFAGLTDDGATIVVDTTTINASQSDASQSDATGIQVSLTTKDGTSYQAEAREGSIDPVTKSAQISGDAVLSAGDEFVITAEGFRFSLDRTRINSVDGVRFRFPGGWGQADMMRFLATDRRDGEESSSHLVFSRNVIVIYSLPNK